MKVVTNPRRTDGFGAQAQSIYFSILYAQLYGYKFVYSPIEYMEHNVYTDFMFLPKAEELMNIQDYYAGDLSQAEYLDNSIYEEIESNLDRVDFSRIKELYWQNKKRDEFNNGKFNISVHVRRYNSRDCRTEGTDTPDEYFLYAIEKLRQKHKDKDLMFHIYSQGDYDLFSAYEHEDTQFHLDEDMFGTFQQMAASDILIISASSYSYTAALLSEGEVIYLPFWHKAKKEWNVIFDFKKLKAEKRKVPLLLCTMKFALLCDYIICNRFNNCHEKINRIVYDEDELKKLKDGQRLFINGTQLETFVDVIVNILQSKGIKITILISNIEPECDRESIFKLLPFAYNIYVANNVIDHPKIHVLPIGLRDPYEVHSTHVNFSHSILRDKINDRVEKDILCLMCFRLDESSSKNRKECARLFSNCEFVTNINDEDFGENYVKQCGNVPINIHYDYINRSKYALCPTGYGFDVHKFYECLYLRTIPIVVKTKTKFDDLYKIFPCLILNSWQELNEQIMKERYEELYNNIIDFETNSLLKILA